MRLTSVIALFCMIVLLVIPVGANVNIYGFAATNPDRYHSFHGGISGDVPLRLGLYSNAAFLDASTIDTQSEVVVGYTWGFGPFRLGGGFRVASEDIKEIVELPNERYMIEQRYARSWTVPYVTGEVGLTTGNLQSRVAMTLARADQETGLGLNVNVGYKTLGNCAVSAAYIRPPHDDWRSGIWYGVSCEI